MLNKKCSITVRTENREENGADYEYKLTVEKSERFAGYALPLYSIFVQMKDKDGTITNAEAKELFADVNKAHTFFDMLVENLATPIDLPYIIEDELSN